MTGLLLAATLAIASADMSPNRVSEREHPANPALGFSLGRVGIFDDLDEPAIASAEYRFAGMGEWQLVPAVGISGAGNGAYFIYADLHYEYRLGKHLVLIPSFGIGRFGGSDEIDLGNFVEFRTGFEIAWQFDGGYRAGLAIHHFSNGGISERNPGIEELVFTLSMPLDP